MYFGLTIRADLLQPYRDLFQPSAEGRDVDFRGYNVGHRVSRLTVPWNMQRKSLAIALLKENKQETSADQIFLESSLCHCPWILDS